MRWLLTGIVLAIAAGPALARDKEITIDEGRISLILPPGWGDSERDRAGTDAIAGYESSDQKTSLYVLELKIQNQADDVHVVLDRTVTAMDQDDNWIVRNMGQIKDTNVNGLPAAYVRVELDLVAGERNVPFVFHFTALGAKRSFFILQGSIIKPVREVREQELFRMIKSFKVNRERGD